MDRDEPSAAKLPFRSLDKFAKEEEGTIVIFTVIMLMVMFMLAGMGIDIMRFETIRTDLQQTSDRAALASASITQKVNATELVTDYFEKAGLGDKLKNVTVTGGAGQALNFKNVTIESRADTNPIFLRLRGQAAISQIEARAFSEAEQRITDVEIVLVLDVSGSMGGNKLNNLKASATEFIDTVLLPDSENKVSISIVPYNAQVNIPTLLKNQFNFTDDNGVANATCVELPQSAFGNGPISRTTAYPMMAYADVVNSASSSDSYDSSNRNMNPSSAFCLNQAQNAILLPQRSIQTLKSKISSLSAGGNTSITLGMKWGVTLLDPTMKTAYTSFVGANAIPPQLGDRPYTYNQENTLKVIVLMTDGEHVQHSYISNNYKTGQSPIWKASNGDYSIQHTTGRPSSAGTNTFWVPHLGTWRSTAFGTGATRLDWKDVWKETRMTWVARQLYARALGTNSTTRNNIYNTWVNNFKDDWLTAGTMDTTLQQTCTFARNNNIIVYGIAFEAPTNAANQIRNCASSHGHYFSATGLEIQSAFRAIASNISQLRLLQ